MQDLMTTENLVMKTQLSKIQKTAIKLSKLLRTPKINKKISH